MRRPPPAWPSPTPTPGCFTFSLRRIGPEDGPALDPFETLLKSIRERDEIGAAVLDCPSCAYWAWHMVQRANKWNDSPHAQQTGARMMMFAYERTRHPKRVSETTESAA